MDEDDKTRYDAAIEYVMDRVERDGIAVVSFHDGRLFAFSEGMLRKLLADAEASPSKMVIAFLPSREIQDKKKVAA